MTRSAQDLTARIEAVWRLEAARIVAGLTRLVRDVGLAEELAQDARRPAGARRGALTFCPPLEMTRIVVD